MEISEDWIRGLTGWKPFKEGKSKADQGLVTGYKQTGAIYQGAIREGRLNLRPTIKIVGPSDVRVQCGCADNRATGGICAHAVAVLLTSLKISPVQRSKQAASSPKALPHAWDLRLSPRFEAELAMGKLSVRLLPSQAAITARDTEICAWLDSKQLRQGAPQPIALRLNDPDCGHFLQIIAGHPRIEIEDRPGSFHLDEEPGPPLRLFDSQLMGSHVVLKLSPDESRRTLIRWGDSVGVVAKNRAYRLPGRADGTGWKDRVEALVANGRLNLPLDEFLADFDAWLDLLEPPQPGWLSTLRLSGTHPEFELEIEGSLEALDATLKVRYPGLSATPLPEPGNMIAGLPCLAPDGHLQARDPAAEDQARRQLLATGFQCTGHHARFRLTGRESTLAFIADDLSKFRQCWTVREGERLATVLKRVHVVRPEIRETNGFGTSLEFELSFQTTGGKRIPSTEIRRILRGGKRNVKLSSGADLVVSRNCEDLVNPLVDELGIARPDQRIQLSGAASILFSNLRENLQNPNTLNTFKDSLWKDGSRINTKDLNARLRDYQSTGANWLVGRTKQIGGALLADEMGLGKTIQAIAAINHFNQSNDLGDGPSLVLAPTSLLGNWMAELARFAPGLKCLLFHGVKRDSLRGELLDHDVIVTSYGTFVRDLALHLKREYRLIIADEASLLRNPDAELSKALAKLKSRGRIALSGTPVENRLQDLWSIFRFVAPGYLGDRKEFKERYETPSGAPPANLLERLRLRISPFVLRRTKDQVAKDLPDKTEVDEWLSLPKSQAELYSSLAKAGLEEIQRVRDQQGQHAGQMHLLTLLLRLRQTCVDPGLLNTDDNREVDAVKMQRLFQLLEERFENGRKTLVFSQFATLLRRIENRISGTYGRTFCIDGSTRNRQGLVDAFQSEPGPAVFLISLKAGGYGLNLTAADAVVHLDPWWNPAVEAQATDRAHRIGQTRPVTIYRLLTRDTVEERVRQMQDRKRAVIEGATGDIDGSVPANWSNEDLMDLIR